MNRVVLSLIVLLSGHYLSAGIVVSGNDTTGTPKAFTSKVTTKAFDRKTGTFFVGLTSTGANNAFAISKATRPNFSSTPAFTGILQTGNPLIDGTIELLTFSPQSSGLGILSAVEKGSGDFEGKTITSIFTDGNPTAGVTTANLKDASGTNDTDGIVNIEGSSNHIFAAVKPSGSFFGDMDTGIALIGVGPSGSTISLDIKDATTGNAGNKAAALNLSSTVLKGTSGGSDVLFTNTAAPMHYDSVLDRLFIGVKIQTRDGNADIAKAVVVARLVCGVLTFQEITPDSALTFGPDEIVVAQGPNISISPNHINVMHASTGPDYLIVDCSPTEICDDCTFTTTCNRVFALPLVNDTSTPTSATNGTLANKDSALDTSTKKFTDAANASGELSINDPITDPAAVVGAGSLPLEADEKISDLVVVGDAVYVSISRSPNSLNDSGIWVSQAMFDDTGKIQRWTPWTAKHVIPLNAFQGITLPGGSTHSGSIKLFEVDGATGHVWYVEADTEKTVGINAWTTGVQSTDLVTNLRSKLSDSCYCVLDLNQTTRGFDGTTRNRYGAFGGVEKVVFARTAIARDTDDPSSPQVPVTDFSSAENIISSSLPDGAGCCQVLEYTRTSTTADNDQGRTNFGFFLAGTENGLYLFTEDGTVGFNPIELDALNEAPFTTGSWKKAPNITGSVVDIKVSSAVDVMTTGTGETIYIVTSEATASSPLGGKVLSVTIDDSINDMFALDNIRTIAQTGSGTFAKVLQFYGIQLIATDNPESATPEAKEQIILATNQGLFRSNAIQSSGMHGIGDAQNQSDAAWTVLNQDNSHTTRTTMLNGVGGVDAPIRHTTWPFSIQDKNGFSTFDRGAIHQYSGIGSSTGEDIMYATFFDPDPFNANSSANAFKTLDRIIYFFSDGGRRFFVYNRTTDPADQTKLGILPYNVSDWNIVSPAILTDPTLANERRFYWVRLLGPTGILLAGTENGVVGLQ